jgi:hypothetical protein
VLILGLDTLVKYMAHLRKVGGEIATTQVDAPRSRNENPDAVESIRSVEIVGNPGVAFRVGITLQIIVRGPS